MVVAVGRAGCLLLGSLSLVGHVDVVDLMTTKMTRDGLDVMGLRINITFNLD